ncbi:hypothetical protein WIA58_09445 [Serratia marcescens]|uniref:hypothetical protein n=1 Tax=Serratia marcescens TaxID=615 RepID=UPI00339C08B4
MATITRLIAYAMITIPGLCAGSILFDPSIPFIKGTAHWANEGLTHDQQPGGCRITAHDTNGWAYFREYDIGGPCNPAEPGGSINWLRGLIAGGVVLGNKMSEIPAGSRYVVLYVPVGRDAWTSVSFDVYIGKRTRCSVVSPGKLDHGTIPEHEADGHSTSIKAELTCDGPADVVVTGEPRKIKMTNGQTSNILVNGQEKATIKADDGTTTFDISSTLSGPVSQPGAATGVGVLLYDVQ